MRPSKMTKQNIENEPARLLVIIYLSGISYQYYYQDEITNQMADMLLKQNPFL